MMTRVKISGNIPTYQALPKINIISFTGSTLLIRAPNFINELPPGRGQTGGAVSVSGCTQQVNSFPPTDYLWTFNSFLAMRHIASSYIRRMETTLISSLRPGHLSVCMSVSLYSTSNINANAPRQSGTWPLALVRSPGINVLNLQTIHSARR